MGLACAEALAKKGWKVYGTYRSVKRAEPLRKLSKTLKVVPLRMDVDSASSVKKAVAQVYRKEKGIDFLMNNAGFVMAGFWEDVSDADLKAQFETNVFGLLRVAREILPIMRAQRSGKILNGAVSDALRMEVKEFGVEVSELVPSEIQTAVVQNSRKGEKALSPDSPYTEFTKSYEAFAIERFKGAAPIQLLVKVVLKALSDQPMKRRYLVKFEDKALYFLKRFLPAGWIEAGIASQFPWCRWPRNGSN
jgi:NADP-dependent 3-hydroxy acid dehydrogenase YdfG